MRIKTVQLLAAASVGLFNQAYPMRQIAYSDTAKKNHTSDLLPKWLKKPTIASEKKLDVITVSPTSIDISGLPKERLVLCLFKNVYKKSEFSKKVQMNIDDHVYYGGSKRPLGATGYPPSELEVERFIEDQKGYIDYLGAVEFKMDFASSHVDTKRYDDDHKTNTTFGVLTAKACIDQLRQEIFLEKLVIDTLKKAFDGSNRSERVEWRSVDWPATLIKINKDDLPLYTEFYICKSIHEIGTVFLTEGSEKDKLLKEIVDLYEHSVKCSFKQNEEWDKRDSDKYIANEKWILEGGHMSEIELKQSREKRNTKLQIKKDKFETWLASRPLQQPTINISSPENNKTAQTWWSMFFNSSTTKPSDVDEPKPPTLS